MNNSYLARAKKMIPDPQILSVVAAKRAKQLALGGRPMVKCDSENYLDWVAQLRIRHPGRNSVRTAGAGAGGFRKRCGSRGGGIRPGIGGVSLPVSELPLDATRASGIFLRECGTAAPVLIRSYGKGDSDE